MRGVGQFVGRFGEGIGTGRQAELFRRQPADALTVHGQLGGPRGRDDHRMPRRLDFGQHVGGDGLDLGHDNVGHFGRNDAREDVRIGHRDDMAAVRHLHGRGVGIAVDGDDLRAQPL